MNFIPVHVLFFDVVPSPCRFRVIQVRGEDGAVFDDSGDAEKSFGDQLLNDLAEQLIERIKSDAFDEVTVSTDIWVVFEAELSSPELVFFKEIMVVSVGLDAEEHQEKRKEQSGG